MDDVIYKVIGVDDFDGVIFCYCSTYEKAKKAYDLLESECELGGVIAIVQDELSLDKIVVDDNIIEL